MAKVTINHIPNFVYMLCSLPFLQGDCYTTYSLTYTVKSSTLLKGYIAIFKSVNLILNSKNLFWKIGKNPQV